MSNYTEPVEVIEVDLDDSSPGKIPAGRWDVAVEDVRLATARSGKQYYQITFDIGAGPNTGDKGFVGRKIYDKEPWVMAMVLKALGYAGKVSIDVNSVMGQYVVVDLGYKPSTDGSTEWVTISKVYHPDDVPVTDATQEEIPFNEPAEPLFPEPPAAPAVPAGSKSKALSQY